MSNVSVYHTGPRVTIMQPQGNAYGSDTGSKPGYNERHSHQGGPQSQQQAQQQEQPQSTSSVEEKTALAAERRRRRRTEAERQVSESQPETEAREQDQQQEVVNQKQQQTTAATPSLPPEPEEKMDFDEDAYLSGQIAINVSANDKPRSRTKERSREVACSWQKPVVTEKEDLTSSQTGPIQDDSTFDEESYLSGRVAIINDTPRQPVKPMLSEFLRDTVNGSADPELNGVVDNESATGDSSSFDEADYLAGKVSLFGGEPRQRRGTGAFDSDSETPSWQKIRPEQNGEGNFDENAYLAANKYGKQGTDEEPDWAKKQKEKLEKGAQELERFEETHYLTAHDHESTNGDDADGVEGVEDFDENAYLAGKITVVGGGNSSLPPRAPNVNTAKSRACWQKADSDEEETTASTQESGEFDEEAYLRGRVSLVRSSVDREIPPREYGSRPKSSREKASWERSGDDDTSRDHRRLCDVRRSVDRELGPQAVNGTTNDPDLARDPPSHLPKNLHYLRRSMSRELSPTSSFSSGRSFSRSSSFDSADDENDPDKAYNDMVYVGRNIPSKTFNKLKRSVQSRQNKSKKKSVDHIEELRIKNLPDTAPIDTAIDKMSIGGHDPDQYLTALKESVQAITNIKIEADSSDVTDF